MKKGDLLLVRYKFDPIGWLIRRTLHCKYNHIAWILNENYIIEIKSKGIRINSIQKYKNKLLYETKILKILEITPSQLNKAFDYALIRTDKGNYFKLLLTYFMVYFRYQGEQPRLSCSGFIAECLSKVNFYFNKRKNHKI